MGPLSRGYGTCNWSRVPGATDHDFLWWIQFCMANPNISGSGIKRYFAIVYSIFK